mmetsp:Transcript_8295/g.17703  ORF Transcript_8295/g.17703 Transcript_8295/m.17703 type:complete len:89 (+) Transcript_8295:53-319(+)
MYCSGNGGNYAKVRRMRSSPSLCRHLFCIIGQLALCAIGRIARQVCDSPSVVCRAPPIGHSPHLSRTHDFRSRFALSLSFLASSSVSM